MYIIQVCYFADDGFEKTVSVLLDGEETMMDLYDVPSDMVSDTLMCPYF